MSILSLYHTWTSVSHYMYQTWSLCWLSHRIHVRPFIFYIKCKYLYVIFRPLDVRLLPTTTCKDSIDTVIDRLQSSLPSERELISLQCRAKRLLNIIENILIQHELLAKEAIHTLRTVRRIAKWTSVSLSAFLIYFYVRKFHSNSVMYKFIILYRLPLTIILGCFGLAVYSYYEKEMCLKTLALIS